MKRFKYLNFKMDLASIQSNSGLKKVQRAHDSDLMGVSSAEETDEEKSMDIQLYDDHTFRGFWTSLDDHT
jgi:hypothetical protein